MARILSLTAFAGAFVALPLLATSPVLAKAKHGAQKAPGGKEKVDSAAYPKSPGSTPATSDNGKPVTPKADQAAKPDAPAKSSEGAPQKTSTPSTPYPGAPGGSPAAGDGGKPVEPKS